MYTVARRRLLTLLSSKRFLEIIQSINGDTILPGSNGRYLSSITLNVSIFPLSLKLLITRRKLYGTKRTAK